MCGVRCSVGQFNAAKFGAPDARRVKQFKHGAVAHAERVAHVGHGQQPFDFGRGERFLGQPPFHPGQFQFAGRVVQDDIAAGEPAKEILECAEVFTLRAPAQALAVGLEVMPEPALKVFEDGARDLRSAIQVALRRPGEKEFEGVAPVVRVAGA